MKRTDYPRPSELLQQQKQTGQSYWDMVNPLPEVTVTAQYPHEQRVWDTVDATRLSGNEPEFMRRLDYGDKRYIQNSDGSKSTHLMSDADNYAFPLIQDVNGQLVDYRKGGNPFEHGDYIKFQTPGDARYFAEHYKKNWPQYFEGFKHGKESMICNYLPGFIMGTPPRQQRRQAVRTGYETVDQMLADEKVRNDTIAGINYLRSVGMSDAVIAGLIGNTWTEGQNRDTTYNAAKTRRGFFQQFVPYADYITKKYGNTYAGQMRFFHDWVTNPRAIGSQDLGRWNKINSKRNLNASDLWYKPVGKKAFNPNAATPEEAAKNILISFERAPGQAEFERMHRARAFYNWMQTLPKQQQRQAGTVVQPATAPANQALPKIVAPTNATSVVQPVNTQPVRIGQPTSYVNPALFQDQEPEQLQEPEVEDNYSASLPPIGQMMQMFFPGEVPYAGDDFTAALANLPGAKYGKDSGIHINPANRGKFNATKKRTGKTTEELAHSKNPLTRKRAIFAMNARKWRH